MRAHYKKIALFVSILFFMGISIVSATVTCSPTSINKTWNKGDTPSSISITCTNPPNATAVTINKIGSYFSLIPAAPISTGSHPSGTTTSIQVDFSPSTPSGTFEGALIFSDSTPVIPITINVNNVAQQVQAGIIVFPTAKVINVQQGQTKSQNIQLIVPSNYPGAITVQSVSFNPDLDVVKFGDLDLGNLNPGTTLTIPLKVDATNAQTGTYSTQVNILATNSTGQVQLQPTHLDVNVQAGINPITNSTFASRPTCTVSSVVMSLNSTYSFTCNNAVSNLRIRPEYSEFFEGLGDETVSGVYTYKFKPTKQGNTIFKAVFETNNGAPLFAAFVQEVRISSVGAAIAGTVLDLLFLPSLDKAKPKERVGIQVTDNKTGDLRSDSQLYIDTIAQNSSQGTFYFVFEKEKNYHIRATAPGYNDLVKIIKLTSIQMNISLSPETGDSLTQFTITTDAPNATLLIDGNKVSNPYTGTLEAGNHQIQGSMDGYIDALLNLSIPKATTAIAPDTFSKGAKQVITLSHPSNWTLYYAESLGIPEEIIGNGSSVSVEFSPENYGRYRLSANGRDVWSGVIENKSWRFLGIHWGWWLGLIVLGVLAFLYIRYKNSGTSAGELE